VSSSGSSGVGPEHDPLKSYYRVEEIERIRLDEERQGKRPPNEPPEDEGKPGFSAFVLLLMDKVLEYVKHSINRGLSAASEIEVRETLLLFKAALETMMQEDRSQDAPFLKRVSQIWQKTLEQSLSLKASSPLGKQLRAFIKEIETYPENEEHTFGYYLDEYVGLQWLPFPYMELILKLHRQHEADPGSSLLARWAALIGEMLGLLNAE
jgi:hypothetical protein